MACFYGHCFYPDWVCGGFNFEIMCKCRLAALWRYCHYNWEGMPYKSKIVTFKAKKLLPLFNRYICKRS